MKKGCFYETTHGWERPSYFISGKLFQLKEYDYYGGSNENIDAHMHYPYRDQLEMDYTFDYPSVHYQVNIPYTLLYLTVISDEKSVMMVYFSYISKCAKRKILQHIHLTAILLSANYNISMRL